MIARNKVGDTVPVQVARGGSPLAAIIPRQPELELGLEAESTPLGCRVTKVLEAGAGEKAGVRVSDVITELDGKRVTQLDQLTQAFAAPIRLAIGLKSTCYAMFDWSASA